MEVDPELLALDHDRPDQHRASGRPRIGARLGLKSELVEEPRDPRDLGRLDLDGQVHDALAGEARNRGAADVLDDQIRSSPPNERGHRGSDLDRSWIPVPDVGRTSLIREDLEVGAVALGIGHRVEV